MKGDFDLYESDPMAHLRPPTTSVVPPEARENRSREAIGRLIDGEFTVKPLPNADFEVDTAMARRQRAYEVKLNGFKPPTEEVVQAAIASAQRHAADTANPDNPKDKFGAAKPCLSYVPPVALMHEAVVMKLGADKYGPFNWRTKPVKAKTYIDAAIRHLLQWADGEELDEQSRASHLAHARACCGILLDAQHTGNLLDDRHKSGLLSTTIDNLTTKV